MSQQNCNLEQIPEISLNSDFPNTLNGFLPFQVKAYNFLKDLDSGIMLMDTGVGKSVVSIGLLKYHLLKENIDVAIVVCKAHNKFNFQRELKEKGDLDALIIDGPLSLRESLYKGVVEANNPVIVITNYEKFRIDFELWKPLFRKRILIIWDEIHSKLKNRNTALYRKIRYLLYKKKLGEINSASLRQYGLTATPIDNHPGEFYNYVRLLKPDLLGSIAEFQNEYAAYVNPYNQPVKWRNLDKLGERVQHITYKVSKTDPEISKQFPRIVFESIPIDWHPDDRHIYEKLSHKSREIFRDEGYSSILPLIMLMQLMCDVPSAINLSANSYLEWEKLFLNDPTLPKKGSEYAKQFVSVAGELYDDNHTKIEVLRELLTDVHSTEKVLIFSSFNNLVLPALSNALNEWNVSHVLYRGTAQQKQTAQDHFKKDDNIRVFLSSDAGSDSINLQEASVVIHFDLPLKHSTWLQRSNRAHRITSIYDAVKIYSLLMADSVDLRKEQIIKTKEQYHKDIFGEPCRDDDSMHQDELRYVLVGDSGPASHLA
jgi:SNF2 family DNA or RNA helicase